MYNSISRKFFSKEIHKVLLYDFSRSSPYLHISLEKIKYNTRYKNPIYFYTAHSIPVENPEYQDINPAFDVYRDVRLLLSTRRNRGNPIRILFRNAESIRSSPFDAAKPTRVLVSIMTSQEKWFST